MYIHDLISCNLSCHSRHYFFAGPNMRIFKAIIVFTLGYFIFCAVPCLNINTSLNQSNPQSPKAEPKVPLTDPQVNIPKENRIYNKSGSQCVWCSAEMLGSVNHSAGCKGLTDQYKHATGPGEFASVMKSRNIKFIQDTKGGNTEIDFMEEWVKNRRRGVGFGIHGTHCILMCHFERNKLVKIIDNSDHSLSVQTWEWNKFNRARDSWVFVILPDTENSSSFPCDNDPVNPILENPVIYPLYPVYNPYPVYIPGLN